MTSFLPTVTFAPLIPGTVSIDSKTISLWVQVSVGSGVYQVGGIPAGVKALANALTVNVNQFLAAYVESELATAASGAGAGYTYRYIPALDYLQIYSYNATTGAYTELGASAIIPAGVLNDVVIGQFIYNRL